MRVVLDTNVLVSGLLNRNGKPFQVLKLVLDGEIILLTDERIFSEYVEVLFRPVFRFPLAEVSEILDLVKRQGEPGVAIHLTAGLPDPDDAPFLEVAVSGEADALVTGNLRHFPVRHGIRVVDPAGFLRLREAR